MSTPKPTRCIVEARDGLQERRLILKRFEPGPIFSNASNNDPATTKTIIV